MISFPFKYHLMLGAGLASNWQLQLASVSLSTMVDAGNGIPIVGATAQKETFQFLANATSRDNWHAD